MNTHLKLIPNSFLEDDVMFQQKYANYFDIAPQQIEYYFTLFDSSLMLENENKEFVPSLENNNFMYQDNYSDLISTSI